MTTTFNNAAALEQAVGQSLGATEWITIDQQRVDTFADATGDHQWIHVDPEKATEFRRHHRSWLPDLYWSTFLPHRCTIRWASTTAATGALPRRSAGAQPAAW